MSLMILILLHPIVSKLKILTPRWFLSDSCEIRKTLFINEKHCICDRGRIDEARLAAALPAREAERDERIEKKRRGVTGQYAGKRLVLTCIKIQEHKEKKPQSGGREPVIHEGQRRLVSEMFTYHKERHRKREKKEEVHQQTRREELERKEGRQGAK